MQVTVSAGLSLSTCT